MSRAWSTCTGPGCPVATPPGQSRCDDCRRSAERTRRPDGNPYNTSGHHAFRESVLERDPICVGCELALSTVADHYPRSRQELEQLGLDPDDPQYGRGLCKPCHDRSTAERQPGGWHADTPGG